jgi:hypothetical protein
LQLGQHAGHQVPHRLERDAEALRDGSVAHAAGEQLQHLVLARGELFERIRWGSMGEPLRQPAGQSSAEDSLAPRNGLHGVDHLVRVRAFEQVAECPSAHCLEYQRVVVVHRQYQDSRRRCSVADLADRRDAARARHVEVEDHDVRLRPDNGVDGLRAGLGPAGNVDIRRTGQQGLQPL